MHDRRRPATLADLIAGREPDPAETTLHRLSVDEALHAGLARLHPRHRHIVSRYWLGGLTFAEIGRELGITRQRVEQLHAIGFRKLREALCD